MQVPPQISFRNMERFEDIEAQVREKVAKLEEFCDCITSCHVVIEAPHQHHRQGNQYRVRIQIAVPHKELVVDRQPPLRKAAEDLRVAVREAFANMRRQLEDYIRQLRGHTKQHAEPDHGQVKKYFPEADYGFIESSDGREVFFHANSILDHHDGLEHGTEVRYVEEAGEKGPQATSIRIVGKHHHLS